MRTNLDRDAFIAGLGPALAHQLGNGHRQRESWHFRHNGAGAGCLRRLDDGLGLRLLAGWATFVDRVEIAPETMPVGSDLAPPGSLRLLMTVRGSAAGLAEEIRRRLVLPLTPFYRRQMAVARALDRPPACRSAAVRFLEDVFAVELPDGADGVTVRAGGTALPLTVAAGGRLMLAGMPIAPLRLAVMAHRLQGVPVS